MHSLSRLALIAALVAPLFGCGSFGPFEELYTGSIEKPSRPANGQVILFRGFVGGVFSRGMDTFAEKIRQSGINASVYSFMDWEDAAGQWIEKHRNDPVPAPLILVGHSIGGTVALQFAKKLQDAGMSVTMVAAFDPARMPVKVPGNVARFINLFQSNSVMGAGDVAPAPGFQGYFASVNLKDRGEIIHVTIDKSGALHDAVLAKIVQVIAMPAPPQGAPAPIKYAPPAGEPIELWDGGVEVAAEAGDTIQTLAARYAVPAWVVAQINALSPRAALNPGQMLIVPRHVEGAPLPRPATSYVRNTR